MIEQIETTREDMLEFRVSGTVTDADYSEVLIPALEKAIAEQERIRLLMRFDAKFKDFTLGALFDDARVGLKHWRGFDRVAVVSDSAWLNRVMKGIGVFLPCPVQTFTLVQSDQARTWLVESLGTIHQRDLGDGVLHLELLGKLDTEAYVKEVEDLDAFIRQNERFKLLLDLRQFDGWQGLAALGDHLNIVRHRYDLVDRVAVVGDATWQRMAEKVVSQFVKAETRYFPSAEFEAAKTWIKGGAA